MKEHTRRKHCHWKPYEDEKLAEMAGKSSVEEIATALKRTADAIRMRAVTKSISLALNGRPSHKVTTKDLRVAVEARACHKSNASAARSLGMAENTFNYHLSLAKGKG